MSAEREQMKIRLTNLRHKEKELAARICDLCATIRYNLNPSLAPIKDLAVPAAASQMDELVLAFGEFHGVLCEIARLEKELE